MTIVVGIIVIATVVAIVVVPAVFSLFLLLFQSS